MYDPLRRRVLALLKVPPEPHPPAGDPASLRVFRAGKNYFRLRLTGWAFGQVLALFGILFWAAILIDVEKVVQQRRATPPPPQPAADNSAPVTAEPKGPADKPAQPPPAANAKEKRQADWARNFERSVKNFAQSAERRHKDSVRNGGFFDWLGAAKDTAVELALLMPPGIFAWLWTIKILTFAAYLLQIPLTYAVRRLDYEMRWYMVTDRSLRLRHGVWKVNESTMSFANIQQVEVSQGPLQRLLGLGDVKVQSAGGGSKTPGEHSTGDDMHVGLFHSVINAAEIRDLILDRLRRYREAGLGDPEEKHAEIPAPTSGGESPAISAARALLAEAQALRASIER